MSETRHGDEAALLRRLAAGDEPAATELFRRHRDDVFRVALGCCGSPQDAVDVVQEVFLALIRQAPTLDLGRARLSTWLYRVARNQAIDLLRRRPATSELVDDRSDGAPAPDERLAEKERDAQLWKAVSRLPPRARDVFVFRVGMGLSVEQTASLVGCRAGAVRTALHDAKRRLGLQLDAAKVGRTG